MKGQKVGGIFRMTKRYKKQGGFLMRARGDQCVKRGVIRSAILPRAIKGLSSEDLSLKFERRHWPYD